MPDVESENSAESDFDEDDDDGPSSKKKNGSARASVDPDEPVMIPMGTKVFKCK
jgi:hypothetical protein